MSLTMGPGPLSTQPAGHTNYAIEGPEHRLLMLPHPRRYQAEIDGVTVLDTLRGQLLFESNHMPKLYVPFEDLETERLERTEHSTHCPFKGDATYWSVRTDGRTVANAVWAYEEPMESASWLRGYASLDHGAANRWLEEDEVLLGHLRDPFHRVDVRESSRHVRVTVGGEVIAESDRPRLLFETGLPVRAYLPEADVRPGVLVPSDTTTVCPYKGVASYRSVQADDATIADAAWFYPEPLGEAAGVQGMLSFLGDGVEVELEGAAAGAPAAA